MHYSHFSCHIDPVHTLIIIPYSHNWYLHDIWYAFSFHFINRPFTKKKIIPATFLLFSCTFFFSLILLADLSIGKRKFIHFLFLVNKKIGTSFIEKGKKWKKMNPSIFQGQHWLPNIWMKKFMKILISHTHRVIGHKDQKIDFLSTNYRRPIFIFFISITIAGIYYVYQEVRARNK